MKKKIKCENSYTYVTIFVQTKECQKICFYFETKKKIITCQNLFYRISLYFFTSCSAQTYFNHSKSQKHSQELTNRHCERSIFQTFWKDGCCAKYLFFELETLNSGYLLIFFIFFDCERFQKFILDN